MERITTLDTRDLAQSAEERRLRRMPDLLPVGLQDLLRGGQSAVREVRREQVNQTTEGTAQPLGLGGAFSVERSSYDSSIQAKRI